MILPFSLSLADLATLLLGNNSRLGLTLAFLLAAALVVAAGIKLSAFGDALGQRTGLGSGLVGLIFLAGITSMPELVVSTTSTVAASLKAMALAAGQARDALLAGGADLALGNMIGSNAFNLMLFVVMDLAHGRGALIYRLGRNHIMSAAAGLGMLGILLFGFTLGRQSPFIIPLLDTGPVTPILFVTYLIVMVLMSKLEKRSRDEGEPEPNGATDAALVRMPAARFYGALAVLALAIVAGGIWLSLLGDKMALPVKAGGFGLRQSFVGTIFLALSTSLPELVVCLMSVRLGFLNMAVGNILGSNIFNLVIIFVADIGLRDASILHFASLSHLVTMAMVMILTCVVIISLIYRSERSYAALGIDAWVMLLIFIVGNLALYLLG